MKHGIFLILILHASLVIAQPADTLSLERAQELAIERFPLLKQNDLYQKANTLNQTNIKASYLPELSVSGQASYQSDVIQFPFSMPGVEVPELPKERWQVYVDVKQPLYSGGSKALKQTLEDQQLAIDLQQQEISVQQLKPMVQQNYFSILLSRQSEKILRSTYQLLEDKLKSLEAAVRGGVALPSDVLRIRTEMSRIEQQLAEVEARTQESEKVLSILTCDEISAETAFQMPELNPVESGINRPELKLLELQAGQLEAQSKLLGTKVKPQLLAFAQVGVGYPNPLNFFDEGSSPYYQAGLRLNWQFWDWKQTQREQQQLNIRQQILSTEEENLERNIRIRLEQQEADITRYQQLMQQDEEIIRMQSAVRQYASRQLDQGVITSTDYLNDVHAEQTARLNYSLHQIQLIQAQIAYLTEKGIY